ncbi:MAG: hypothetical protein ACJ8J7_03075 [Sulfurifustaceae bacterium]
MKRTFALSLVAACALYGCASIERAPSTSPTPASSGKEDQDTAGYYDYSLPTVYHDYKDYDALVARAQNEIKRAADKGFLWLYTERYLADSRAAQKAGNMDDAMKLAQKALEEALLAQKQAADAAKVRADYTYRR